MWARYGVCGGVERGLKGNIDEESGEEYGDGVRFELRENYGGLGHPGDVTVVRGTRFQPCRKCGGGSWKRGEGKLIRLVVQLNCGQMR